MILLGRSSAAPITTTEAKPPGDGESQPADSDTSTDAPPEGRPTAETQPAPETQPTETKLAA